MKKVQDIRSFFKQSKTADADKTTESNDVVDKAGEEAGTSTSFQIVKDPETSSCTLTSSNVSDLGTKESGPQQPKIAFKKVVVNGKQRSFSSKYYEEYDWLEYSAEADKAFCFVCRNFGSKETKEQNEKFVVSGFEKWKKLGEALKKHEKSYSHIQSIQGYKIYKSSPDENIHDKILQQHSKEIFENREYLKKIINIILLLTRQGLSLRGHKEDINSKNRGNFLEIAENFSKYDASFKLHFNKPKNYCSSTIQNEIIEISANVVINTITENVKVSGFFSLMVDEARCYKEEQLSITIRYAKNLEVEERFLGFVDCSINRDSTALQKLILEFLETKKLSNIPIIGQSYDGANVMSGFKNGLQAKIKESNPQAIFIHCLAHKLNLVIVDSCSHISSAQTFFNAVEALCIHFSKPGNHSDLKRISKALQVNHLEIKSLSTTRWSCRYENCKSIMNNFVTIKGALEEEISQARDKNSVEALGLLTLISKPDFIVSLHVFHFALLMINVLNKYFQTTSATLGEAHDSVAATIDTFKENRNKFDELWSQTEDFAKENDISLDPLRVSKRKKGNLLDKDFHVETTLGKSKFVDLPDDISSKDYWKVNVYYPVIDSIISNLKYRFQSVPLAESVNAFIKLDLKGAAEFIDNYKNVLKIDCDSMESEIVVLRNMFKNTNSEKSINLDMLRSKIDKNIYPNIYKLLQVAISLPISSAGCERSFSAMRRIKTWLRSTMNQDRFSSLAILNIENEVVKNYISTEEILNIFCKKNRKILLE